MSNNPQLCEALQTLWHTHFPLSKLMDVSVLSYEQHVLTTYTRLTPNTNIHNTAFAGSLYAIESLTAWGLLYLELKQAGFDASIIHASGRIDFVTPVHEDIVAITDFDGHERCFTDLAHAGKARLSLKTQVYGASDAARTNPASHFEGLYVVRLNT